MIEIESCPACDGRAIKEIGVHIAEIMTPPPNIQQAGTNALLSRILRSHSHTTRTLYCRTCTHVFLTPSFENEELTAFYSTEHESEIKRQYRLSEKASGKTWAEQNRIRPQDMEHRAKQAQAYRPRRLFEIVQSSMDRHSKPIKRVLDVGGQTGEIISGFAHSQRFIYDLNPTQVVDPEIVVLRSMSDVAQSAPYDLAVMSHVLEHVPFPARFIESFLPYLSADGLLYAEVPLEYCGAIIKRRGIPLGAHVNYFTKRSLQHCLIRGGLGRIRIARREIAPYGELRMATIKVVASVQRNAKATVRRSLRHLDVIYDSALILWARKTGARY